MMPVIIYSHACLNILINNIYPHSYTIISLTYPPTRVRSTLTKRRTSVTSYDIIFIIVTTMLIPERESERVVVVI